MENSPENEPAATTPHMMEVAASNEEDEGSGTPAASVEVTAAAVDGEEALIQKLGFSLNEPPVHRHTPSKDDSAYQVIPNPEADRADLSDLRGTKAPTTGAERLLEMKDTPENDDDLYALAEILPELKSRTREASAGEHVMTMEEPAAAAAAAESPDLKMPAVMGESYQAEEGPIEVVEGEEDIDSSEEDEEGEEEKPKASDAVKQGASIRPGGGKGDTQKIETVDSMMVQDSQDGDDDNDEGVENTKPSVSLNAVAAIPVAAGDAKARSEDSNEKVVSSASEVGGDTPVEPFSSEDQNLGGFDDANSDEALNSEGDRKEEGSIARQPPQLPSSSASLSTATQTHEVRMPMYLPTFKPATGCTNASDFIVRCFVARLRSGITVVKHGRSRWCKSRLRILHIHPDGRSLSWKPAVGEPTSSKRPPKLDLSTCTEVRHAWSPDPLNPMFTGTPILRQKCEAANAHKSFALIFPKRTVDITAVTADQCKVLMEGFSALCFRLQVANLAGRGNKKGKDARDEEEVATTASVTLTNNSTQLSPSGSGSGRVKRTVPKAR